MALKKYGHFSQNTPVESSPNGIALDLGAGNMYITNMNIRAFQRDDENTVISLWKTCDLIVPWNNPSQDIQRKLKVDPALLMYGKSASLREIWRWGVRSS